MDFSMLKIILVYRFEKCENKIYNFNKYSRKAKQENQIEEIVIVFTNRDVIYSLNAKGAQNVQIRVIYFFRLSS